eukprot:SAG31_NODE_387_length_16403_cov_5.062071_13_plen_357_part_00
MAVPEAELEPVPEQTAAQSEDGEPKWCCHCRTSPAQSQTAIVCTILTDPKYGYCWKQWPTEEWTYKGAGPTPRTRPRDSKRVDFTNSGFHAGRYTISSVDETEMLYDRLNLCDLTGARDNIDSDICPPTYIFSAQYSAPEFETERSWMDEGVWFLKENLQNYGQGTWVVKTPKQASKLVQKGKDYVLQPHIAKPLLYDGRKFHIRLYLLIVKDEVGQYPSSTGYNNRFCESRREFYKFLGIFSSLFLFFPLMLGVQMQMRTMEVIGRCRRSHGLQNMSTRRRKSLFDVRQTFVLLTGSKYCANPIRLVGFSMCEIYESSGFMIRHGWRCLKIWRRSQRSCQHIWKLEREPHATTGC